MIFFPFQTTVCTLDSCMLSASYRCSSLSGVFYSIRVFKFRLNDKSKHNVVHEKRFRAMFFCNISNYSVLESFNHILQEKELVTNQNSIKKSQHILKNPINMHWTYIRTKETFDGVIFGLRSAYIWEEKRFNLKSFKLISFLSFIQILY